MNSFSIHECNEYSMETQIRPVSMVSMCEGMCYLCRKLVSSRIREGKFPERLVATIMLGGSKCDLPVGKEAVFQLFAGLKLFIRKFV